jgi:cytochrome c5
MKYLLPLLLAGALGACNGPDFKPIKNLVYLNQGDEWTPKARAIFYYTPQGTMLHRLRYSWFQYLETSSGERLAAPRHLARFGFLYSPEQFDPNFDAGALNPANLPVGFAHHRGSDGEDMLDITCAACHTGQLEYRGVALRVDGGQALHAFAWIRAGQFITDLIGALTSTYANPFKFDRFAENVLGTRYPDGKPELREELARTLAGFNHEALTTIGLFKDDGYGRIDALGHIANTVFGDRLSPRNNTVADAPVSYPHVWDIWKFDWAQWNGSVAQPMGRNVGEALGVKAELDLVDSLGNPLPPERMYKSSVLIEELHCIETTLWQLRAPQWPENIFPAIDAKRADRGRSLFEANCQTCHGPNVYPKTPLEPVQESQASVRYECAVDPHERQPTPEKPIEWKMCVMPTWKIGTDPQVVNNFLDRRYDASALDPGNPALADISAGEALNFVTAKVIDRGYRALGIEGERRWAMDGWGRPTQVRDMRGYKARPLHGIWATPPFLHNGSVRTLYQLLSPEAEREKKFWVGSREFDPIEVGYRNEEVEGAFELDTQTLGNSNAGHQFSDDGGAGILGRGFSRDERLDLIEYLKTLGNPAYDREYYTEPRAGDSECPTQLQGPASIVGARWPL